MYGISYRVIIIYNSITSCIEDNMLRSKIQILNREVIRHGNHSEQSPLFPPLLFRFTFVQVH